MKARDFAYEHPTTLAAALDALSHPDTVALGGGQTLLAGMNLRLASPARLVDLEGIEDLKGIRETDAGLEIGAYTRHVELIESPLVRRAAPLLAEAAGHIAHAAVRNRGTLGGSLAYADPAAELPACCVALEAEIEVAGPIGRRRVPAGTFFHGMMETDLQPGEIITAVHFSAARGRARYRFEEVSRRHGDYALAGVILVDGPDPRLVYFGCADRPVLAPTVAKLMISEGQSVSDAALLKALAADFEPLAAPGCRADTKLRLAATLTRRVVSAGAAEHAYV